MHDLNDALDELRHVIPYAHSPSVRKLSKIATLLLAKNFILMQSNALQEMRKMLICLHQHSSSCSGEPLPSSLSSSIVSLVTSSGALIMKSGATSSTPGSMATKSISSTNKAHVYSSPDNKLKSTHDWDPTSTGNAHYANGTPIRLSDVEPAPKSTASHGDHGASNAANYAHSANDNNNNNANNNSSPSTQVSSIPAAQLDPSMHQAPYHDETAICVQNRRRKYHLLINRILGI